MFVRDCYLSDESLDFLNFVQQRRRWKRVVVMIIEGGVLYRV